MTALICHPSQSLLPAAAAPKPKTLVFSTSAAQPGRRLAVWQQQLAEAYLESDHEYRYNGDFWATIRYCEFGSAGVGRISGSRRTVIRSATRARQAEDGVYFCIPIKGNYAFNQGGRDGTAMPGEAFFFHNCLPGEYAADEGAEYWCLSLPATWVAKSYPDSSPLAGRKVTETRAELQLLCSYLSALERIDGVDDAAVRETAGRHLSDLVLSSAGVIRDGSTSCLREMRLRQARAEIARRFREPMLNGERVASGLGISVRYLQALFEEAGTTLSQFLADIRLRCANAELRNAEQDHRTISDIAYGVGFSDLSYFNRCYRRQYGETPKATRGA